LLDFLDRKFGHFFKTTDLADLAEFMQLTRGVERKKGEEEKGKEFFSETVQEKKILNFLFL
jgi:hypothetical protein